MVKHVKYPRDQKKEKQIKWTKDRDQQKLNPNQMWVSRPQARKGLVQDGLDQAAIVRDFKLDAKNTIVRRR